MRTKLTHRFWARALAFFLLMLSACGVMLGAVTIVTGVQDHWFYETPDFAGSWVCRMLVQTDRHNIVWAYWNNMLDSTVYVENAEEGNIFFEIREEESRYLIQSTRAARGSSGITQVATYPFEVGRHDEEKNVTVYETLQLDLYLRNELRSGDRYYTVWQIYQWCYANRNLLIEVSVGALLLCLALYIFLLCSAGHREGVAEPVPIRQDRIPLDLYLVLVGIVVSVITAILADIMQSSRDLLKLPAVAVGLLGYLILFIALSMTIAARLKVGKWWRNTLIWHFFRAIGRLLKAIPVVWKSVLIYVAFCIAGFLTTWIFADGGGFGALAALNLLVLFFGGLALVCILGIQMKNLRAGGRALAEGNLSYRVNTVNLYGDFRRHGEDLNRINEGMGRAVEERMRSERFKTELITNVSHDIKTPLTSIINYIDLLKKEEGLGERAGAYIEVLDRQSQRLKKLTEDVVEASKASTGVIPVEAARLDAGELLQQALGEYEERLEESGITPVVTQPEDGAVIWADGRLLWRVFDNLLLNICKYAQPGTRAYFDITKPGGMVEIVVKNISAAPLNISADALMERFVRGDASRSSEGSGLGLSIARSLTELQGGRFLLQLDGDLFKVFIRFPQLRDAAPENPIS